MINRDLIRIKVVQLLYANQINPDDTYLKKTRKEDKLKSNIGRSLTSAYELYFWMLQLIVELHTFACKRLEFGMRKRTATAEELNPNRRFVDNKFALQLAENKALKAGVKKFHVSWAEDRDLIKSLFRDICKSREYNDYMKGAVPADAPEGLDQYGLDKFLWRNLVKRVLANNEALGDCLEELNIFWNDDAETIISFVEKTIKKFREDAGAEQELLPMFKDEDDETFAYELYQYSLEGAQEYREIIDNTVKNWKVERMTIMDMSIMTAAIAEFMHFPTIPVPVTLNEYIEISKFYSTPKSYEIVNGVLDSISKQLADSGKLQKVKSEQSAKAAKTDKE